MRWPPTTCRCSRLKLRGKAAAGAVLPLPQQVSGLWSGPQTARQTEAVTSRGLREGFVEEVSVISRGRCHRWPSSESLP